MKVCKQCGEEFKAEQRGAKVCSTACAITFARAQSMKAKHLARKRKLLENDRSHHMKMAQQEFNKYIRMRDAHLPCISCGRHHNGQYHAGHYRTTAAQGALRFNELNCWRQCQPCNTHLSGNITEYRIELMKRIGPDLVEWLEKDHGTKAWTIDELKQIRAMFKKVIRQWQETPGAAEPF